MKSSERKAHAKLGKEVSNLASQVVAAIKSSAVRNEMKGIGKAALGNLRATGNRIMKSLQKAKESEATQEIKSQARRVYQIGKSKGEERTKHLRHNLAKGLHHIGKELQQLAKNIHNN